MISEIANAFHQAVVNRVTLTHEAAAQAFDLPTEPQGPLGTFMCPSEMIDTLMALEEAFLDFDCPTDRIDYKGERYSQAEFFGLGGPAHQAIIDLIVGMKRTEWNK